MAGPQLDAILDKQHRNVLNGAVRNVLGTELALETCAQIADGLPLARVAYDQYGRRREQGHPVSGHTSLCPGAEEIARDFLSGFAIDRLNFDDQLLQAYQSAPPGHHSFHCRLIELVAVAVHKMAVLLFGQGHRVHDKEPKNATSSIDIVSSWQSRLNREALIPPPGPTLFEHVSYGARDQYPDGVADAVGYWAENIILGGVVLFDRSEAWDDERTPEPNVYLHSDRDGVTFRVWQALDEQQQALVDFLLSSSPVGTCPCPLAASDKNLTRINPEGATEKKVYRDIWEREPPNRRGGFGARGLGGCIMRPLDYPKEALSKLESCLKYYAAFQTPVREKGGVLENFA
ncbi:hypothetical protein C8A01DRAFT_50313 [Parachaetomium inaequale]|uniref:Uncharacterized protein n=1 Tax=Parachaetomium inaequale TaxID=2588326 RepID=A0AAN6P7C4_9PEZI|nr:hypothetical protein C8A01DRAFT_50313 [Parachaetomium inaequale]